MDHHGNVPGYFSHRMNSRIDQLGKVLIIRYCAIREKHAATDFIAHLYNIRKTPLCLQRMKNILCVGVYSLH